MKRVIGSIGVALMCMAVVAVAQDPGGGPPQRSGRHGGPGGGRDWSPDQFRQRMAEHMKEQLKASDEEWSVIDPLLQKVMDARMAGRGFGRFMGRRGGSDGGDQAQQPESANDKLRKLLEDENASADALKAALDAMRAERVKQDEDLKQAREALRAVLTLRQEAQLVMMGILD